jgi:phosphoglycerate dehydrogenase-like enzyme
MSKPNNVVTIFSSIEGIAQTLRAADPSLQIEVAEDSSLNGCRGALNFDPSLLADETKHALQRAEILIAEPAVIAKLLEHDASVLSSLQWCQSTYAGVDPLFKSNLSFPLPWKLTRFAGCFGPPIAEWCVARIIGHERGFASSTEDQRKKSWAGSKDAVLNYSYLSSLTLSVLGCGDIGRCIAKAAKTFGMKTIGYVKTDRIPDGTIEGIYEYTTNVSEAIKEADYILSVLPSTSDTRGLLNGNAFLPGSESQGGKCPVFINVGRGDVIDEKSLLNALNQQWLSAAILDVFEIEPLPEESQLWNRPDVVISPHVSGLTHGDDIPKVFLDNYKRFTEGRELNHLVDWDKGH